MAFLIMNRSADSARDRLLETFWPDVDPERARNSLNTAIHSIRRSLRIAGIDDGRFVVVTRSVVRWTADTSVDTDVFAGLAAREDPSADQQALQLYRGDFLEGDYDDWSVTERERLAAQYESVLARVVRTSGDVEAATRFIDRNPYDEEAYAALIESELAGGRRATAALWVERCRNALSEVGERPSASFDARFGTVVHIPPGTADEIMLPFAGRETELAVLVSKLKGASDGKGSITLVHGEAGIGKSTLIMRSAHGAADYGLRVLEVRCAAELPNPFGPWQPIYNSVGAEDFDAFVRAHPSDLAAAVGEAIASRLKEPTALFLDDAHELTGEALDIFVSLAHKLSSRHAVIAAMRREGIELLRLRLMDVPYDELAVGHLERRDLQWALAQSMGGEQIDVLEVLYSRSGGHPLFFSGLLNSLVNSGALARDGRFWRLTRTIGPDIELPDTVRRFIEIRLRARGDTPRTVACALALEPSANADDLQAALGMDEFSVLDALDDLLALGLIVQPDSGAQFAFSHDLVREVAAAGLNAGRRTTIHRAFARRLKISDELEASLRLARHLEASGERLAAGQSYLKSAEEALELNASQDAVERCNAGIRTAEKVERSEDRDRLLARLNGVAARAAVARGNIDDAIVLARGAVALARAGGDLRESIRAMIDLAAIEGATFLLPEQKSDAAEAVQNARFCGDDALQAEALVQQAGAARGLGLRDEALQVGFAAHALALRCDRLDISQSALAEILSAQTTWWLFDDAMRSASTGSDTARRMGPLAEAAFLQMRGDLACLLERLDEALSHVRSGLRILEGAVQPRRSGLNEARHQLPSLQFAFHYMAAKIAALRQEWDAVLAAAERAAAIANVARLPHHREALTLLRIDALLQRNSPGDSESARDLADSLRESTIAQGSIGWSDCVELARARVAARMREPSADSLLRRALNVLEENAHRSLLDADRAFSRLEEAASEYGNTRIGSAAGARSAHFRSRRIAAAGAAWGG